MFVDPPKFTVIRDKWSYGEGKHTRLLNDFGKYDVIGFLLLAAGASDEHLLNVEEPIEIVNEHEWITKLIEWYGNVAIKSASCAMIIEANDAETKMPVEDRERKLIDLFKAIDIELVFQ